MSLDADPEGAFVELLGDVRDQTVVLRDGTAGPAGRLLREAGATVLDDVAASAPGAAHAVVLAAVRLDRQLLVAAGRVLRPDGRLLLVAANRRSPLAVLDRLRGGAALTADLPSMRSAARRAGLVPRAAFGLLRSIGAPSTFVSLEHPELAVMVLEGSAPLMTGARRLGVRGLAALARRGQAGAVVPALALLASAAPLPGRPMVGRIGVLGSTEVKLLYGSPLEHVDKVYTSEAVAAAEAAALEQVEAVWPGLAPRLLARRGPLCNRTTWVQGRPLPLAVLGPAEGERRVLEASELLGRLHRRLGPAAPGTRLVHGDYWLGNLLVDVESGALARVVDWTDARSGDDDVDRRFLVDTWADRSGLSPAARAALHAAAEQAYLAGLAAPVTPD